ncbi:MAG: type II secretion system GspH family protein [Pseudomonadales bacterium]|nr:type II secretion system GspH family protein [Pseudomonadales bacterium]
MKEQPHSLYRQSANGFTLLEALISMAIIGLVTAVALPSYQDHLDRADNALAAKDIALIDQAIEVYYADKFSYPPTLNAVGYGGLQDPWGNNYEYLRFDEDTKRGDMRKDRNLVPVNNDYDLYSKGKNGVSSKPFTSNPGRDDIVRANNGRYIGLAEDY